MSADKLHPQVNPGHEIKEISQDFLRPVEVLREALANSYDAGADNVRIVAQPQTDQSGRRILSLDIIDDGGGMEREPLEGFFGLGFSIKDSRKDRVAIGYKGHGTKVYYSALDIHVLTKTNAGDPLFASVVGARTRVQQAGVPEPDCWSRAEGLKEAMKHGMELETPHGTWIRLVDFTADSSQLIDDFRRDNLENYIRWFTAYGSFAQVFDPSQEAPFILRLQGTDQSETKIVEYGHPWPEERVEIKQLRRLDERRPFNHFIKTFHRRNISAAQGYQVDIAVAFEGRGARLSRDPNIRRPGRVKRDTEGNIRLYTEDERYGLWLCRDHIPIEMRTEWLTDDRLSAFHHLEPKRALVLVNCQDFRLTANRGSVGNSQPVLLSAVKDAVVEYLAGLAEDTGLEHFLQQYHDDQVARLREKDRKALQKRILRYNNKDLCRIRLPEGDIKEFYEPQREITLFGIISKLEEWDPDLLPLDILDYDDHRGLDLLVRRRGNDPSDQLSRDRVAYTELKYRLESRVNHAFLQMHSIICWESMVGASESVTDATDVTFTVSEDVVGGVTHTRLIPPVGDKKHNHNIEVIVLRRLLAESRSLESVENPRKIRNGRSRSAR